MNGIINVYKERGYTSHDVVAKLRGILKQKKIGHTGTLDPEAEGVLPVCLGKATKLCDLLAGHDKVYEAVMLLGQFVGPRMQTPPMYSAVKINGQPLYKLARQGMEVERKARPVVIHEITILEMDLPRVKMRVHCSSGTYIRTLCYDIGEKLGCHGCMKSLLRVRVAGFDLEHALTLSQIQSKVDEGCFDMVMPVEGVFDNLPAVHTA